jgi:hypothetical protein
MEISLLERAAPNVAQLIRNRQPYRLSAEQKAIVDILITEGLITFNETELQLNLGFSSRKLGESGSEIYEVNSNRVVALTTNKWL